MKTDREESPGSPHLDPCPDGELTQEFDALISPDGNVIFSWSTPVIQDLARLLGIPEFDPPRWCG